MSGKLPMSKKWEDQMDDPARRAAGQLGEYGTMKIEGGRPYSDIVGDIVGHAQEIVRSEMRLAKAELKEEAAKAARASVLMVAGAIAGLYALGFLLWTIAYLIGLALPLWAGALIIGILTGIAAGVMLAAGIARFRKVEPAPDKAIHEVKEDVAWLKQQTK